VQRYLDGDRDLAMRRELAREHFDNAQVAFRAIGTDEHRRIAMREAAAAMALDPVLDGPAELVTRLMLEPPKHTPPAVQEAIHDEDVRNANAIARAGLWALFAAILFTPFLWWIAPSASSHVIALTVLLVIDSIVCMLSVRTGKPWPGLVIAGNAIIVVVIALMFSPILIAPGLGAVLAMAGVMTPRFSILGSARLIAVIMMAAALVPLGLEYLGAIDHTISVTSEGVLFRAPAIASDEGPAIVVGVIYTVGLIAGSAGMAEMMRRRARDAYRQIQMQAWQLRQLVPR
jgi:hypothetical protein